MDEQELIPTDPGTAREIESTLEELDSGKGLI